MTDIFDNGTAYCDSVPCVLHDEIPPQTNAQKIRSMSDEELAEFLLEWISCDKEGFMCHPKEYKESGKCDGRCVAGRIDWLRQPVEGGK